MTVLDVVLWVVCWGAWVVVVCVCNDMANMYMKMASFTKSKRHLKLARRFNWATGVLFVAAIGVVAATW